MELLDAAALMDLKSAKPSCSQTMCKMAPILHMGDTVTIDFRQEVRNTVSEPKKSQEFKKPT